ncbi:LysM peptidoglycan-binding domain-containing protein, partial [Ligilactobacillus salivarius]|nr:LysM peptidoglycan-binding domain-containing protein [Ligilactobacillus salivarius]
NVSLQQLMELNHFKSDQIYAGQIIKIREKLFRNINNKLF